MTKKAAVCLFLAIICLFSGVGCSKDENIPDASSPEVNDQIQIGITFDSYIIERWIRDRDVFVATASDLGAEVNVQNANGNVEEQRSQIEYFIRKDMDVIVIIAVDCDTLAEEIKKAQDADIKIIAYDRLIRNADVDLYVSFDNAEVGRLMGESLVTNLPGGGNVFAINGPTSDNNVLMIQDGFKSAIANSGIVIVYTDYCDGWKSDLAFASVNRGLEKTMDVSAVMCGNDDLATQAFRALAENRMADKVILVGQDADLAACQRIVEGTQAMTVYKPVDDLAKAAAEYAVRLAKGEPLDTTEIINDGKNSVPYYALKPIAVTKKNIDKVIIDSGFHLREDVYLNVKQEVDESEETS